MDTSKFVIMLLVEDDLGDQKLTKNALTDQEVKVDLHTVGSGEDGLRYLQRSCNQDTDSPLPNLILLDLNMPGMGGKEFLKEIKADEQLSTIPVVILTTSNSDTDVQECYKLNAAGYIQKPGSVQKLKEIMAKSIKYWFEQSTLVER